MDFNLEESIDMLSRIPGILNAQLSKLSASWTHENEGPDTWSPFDVVGHLIHGEKTDWIPRTRIILDPLADKHFVPYDRFAQFEESKGKTMEVLLEEFAMLRQENVESLKSMNITEEDLQKTGIHPEFGEVTLKEMLAAWVVHDLGHLVQINRVMAKQYKAEAGPWPKYLRVLD